MAKFELKDPLSWLGGKAEENKTDKTDILDECSSLNRFIKEMILSLSDDEFFLF